MEDSILTSTDTEDTMLGVIAKKHRDRSRLHSIKAYSTVVGGFIYMLFPGSLYILGNIYPYIASYFHLEDKTAAANLLPAIITINVFIMPIGTTMIQRNVNPKKLIFVAGFLAFLLLNVAAFVEN